MGFALFFVSGYLKAFFFCVDEEGLNFSLFLPQRCPFRLQKKKLVFGPKGEVGFFFGVFSFDAVNSKKG